MTAEDKKLSPAHKKFATMVMFHAKMKQRMIDKGLLVAKATCPICKTKDSVRLSRARSNDHVHWACTAKPCDARMME